LTLHSLQSNTTSTYIGDSHRSGSFKMAIVANNLKKFAILLEIVERYPDLRQEYKKRVSSLMKNEPVITPVETDGIRASYT
jgi:hypothetical protein